MASDSPARGKVFAKTGTYFWDNTMNNRVLLTSKALAGTMTTASNRNLAIALFVNNVHLEKAADTAREYAHQAMEQVQERSKQASESFRQGYDQASEALRQRYEDAEEMIKERPAESAAVCFGVGMLVGVVLGLALRSR